MAMLQQYAPKDVVVAVNGINITGFSDDMVSITRGGDLVNETVGAQGDLQLTINHNNIGEITFTLLQNSASNVDFENYYMTQQGNNTATIGSITVSVPNSGLVITCNDSYMKSIPDFAFSSDNQDRTWTFGCASIEVEATDV